MKSTGRPLPEHELEPLLDELKNTRVKAPPDFVDSVMASLPKHPRPTWKETWESLWPRPSQWLVPALSGAAATLLVLGVAGLLPRKALGPQAITVTFELHAPAAENVELLGSFNQWQHGAIRLQGPDAAGYWSVDVPLPEGRHEYVFLVDGQEWVADPSALLNRPDGFGRVNSVLEL